MNRILLCGTSSEIKKSFARKTKYKLTDEDLLEIVATTAQFVMGDTEKCNELVSEIVTGIIMETDTNSIMNEVWQHIEVHDLDYVRENEIDISNSIELQSYGKVIEFKL